MSGAVNMFLHQCVLRGGLPFAVEMPQYTKKTLNAMEDARILSRDSDVPAFDNIEELKSVLDC